jgi:hypothetical protein
MAQSTRDFPGTIDRGAAVRGRIVDVWAAQDTLNSGATAPANPQPYQFWADTTAAVLKQRNGANNAWIDIAPLAAALVPLAGGIMTGLLTLSGAPTVNLHAATKQYVDTPVDELRGGVSAVIATTSGTAHDVTGLPSWVNEIEVMFRGVSLDGGGFPLIQLGTSGGFVTTGYTSGAGTRFADFTSSSGFLLLVDGAANVCRGTCRIVRQTANTWVATFTASINDTSGLSAYGAGTVDLGGTLTQLRFTRTANNFDAGDFVVRWRR